MKLKFRNYVLLLLLTFTIVLVPASASFAANPSYSEIISPGVIRKKYEYNNGKQNTIVNVLECNLDNPLLEIAVIPGKGKYNQRATVSQMAKSTDATAVVNGDFFNMALQGTPEGPSIVDGKLQSSPCVMQGVYSLGIDDKDVAHIEPITFSGTATASNGKTYPIDGLNKSYYWYEPTVEYSHENKIQLYNDFWASSTRGDKKNTEVLVNQDGVVEQISENKSFPFPVPDGKIIMQVDGTAKDFIMQNVSVGSKIKLDYDISPNRNWKFLVGGHALLVDNGAVVPYTKDINVLGGVRARTAGGISKDGKTLYLATAEARTNKSAGMSLKDMSNFMVSIGADRAVNLDGGGSTTMVVKNLGEFNHTRVTNPEKNGAERPVVSGIGIFNTAKETGEAVGVKINGPDTMMVGESAEFSMKGAWDENYKPVDPNTMTYDLYDSNNDEEAWNKTWYLARTPGDVEIKLVTNTGVTGTKKVTVHDFSYIDKFSVTADKTVVNEQDSIKLTAKAKLKNGKEITLSPSVLKYSIDGFDGEFDNGTLKINSLNNNNFGTVTVTAGDKSASVKLTDSNSKIIKMKIGNKSYTLNNETKKMDASPFIKNDRTMVPVKFIIDAFGGETSWDKESRTAIVKYNNDTIEIPIDSTKVKVNGESKTVDSPAIIKDSRTFVPVRFIAENFGMEITYDPKTKEVTIIEGIKENKELDNKKDNAKETKNEDNKKDNVKKETSNNNNKTESLVE